MIALGLLGLIFAVSMLSWGSGGAWSDRVVGAARTLTGSGWPPLLFLLGALGIGRIARPWLGTIRGRWVIEIGIGLTITLSLIHLLGIAGLLNPISAWLLTGTGLLLLIGDVRRIGYANIACVGCEATTIAITCGGLLAVLMAVNPPGMLWGSEYGGFDALSYHLQLPREWIEQGRIWPSTHNVYSFLPGYVEGAYMHLALLTGGTITTHDARAAMSAQMLSAFMLILSAGCVGELARSSCARLLPSADAPVAGRLGIALTLGTPWLLVVGTLAYNEIAVVLLGACALSVAMRTDIGAWRRAVLCAVIVGGACSCKPTALFLLAPSVGIVLLACSPRRRWAVSTGLCVAVGAVTIAPWLIRNAIEAGNPVFPQLHDQLGRGHWTAAQHEIYAAAHRFDGTILDRFLLLVLPDPNGPDHVSRFRGLSNAQWGPIPLLGLFGLGWLLGTRATRRVGLVATLALAIPIVCWAMLTHNQSRFLIPLAPLLIVLAAIGVARIRWHLLRNAIASVLALGSVIWCVALALVQGGSSPFILIDLGPGVFMRESGVGTPPWTAVVNELTSDAETVYLLGDATPFYVTGDVRYNTVYDRWIIEDAIDAHPDDPARWSETLRAKGIDLVVVSFTEIDRYAQSGWLPDLIDPTKLIEWIDSLGQPIEVWSDPSTGAPLRAVFRIDGPTP